jgi:hypothetical protein
MDQVGHGIGEGMELGAGVVIRVQSGKEQGALRARRRIRVSHVKWTYSVR